MWRARARTPNTTRPLILLTVLATTLALATPAVAAGTAQGPETDDDAVLTSADECAPPFDDVPADSVHAPSICQLVEEDVTTGVTADEFDPSGLVTRAQMASLIARALDLDAVDGSSFPDVPVDSVHAANINALAQAGIAVGREDGTYDPSGFVTRAQAASLLVRATGLEAVDGSGFDDVDPDSVHAPNIAALHEAGITTGVTESRFDPSGNVRRDQMASFLARALDAVDPEPDPEPDPDPDPEPEPAGTVTGTVEDAVDGAPVAGATVTAEQGGDDASTDSGDEGVYELELAPGTYDLEVERDGYATASVTDVEVGDDEVTGDVDVVLQRDDPPSGSTFTMNDDVIRSDDDTRFAQNASGWSENPARILAPYDADADQFAKARWHEPVGPLSLVDDGDPQELSFTVTVASEHEDDLRIWPALIVEVDGDVWSLWDTSVVDDGGVGTDATDLAPDVDSDGWFALEHGSSGTAWQSGDYAEVIDALPDAGADAQIVGAGIAAGGVAIDGSTFTPGDEDLDLTITDLEVDEPEPEPGSIVGEVTDADDGDAIEGAEVTVDGPTSASADTGADGTYAITDLEAGTYDVTAEADGFEPASETDVELAEGAEVTVDLTLATEDDEVDPDAELLVMQIEVPDEDEFVGDTYDFELDVRSGIDGEVDIDIDWGDGTTDEGVFSSITHEYEESGPYTITVEGVFTEFRAVRGVGSIISVDVWQNTQTVVASSAFRNAEILESVAEPPETVELMGSMFRDADSFNQDIGDWDTSNVRDMSNMFEGADAFDQDIGGWDTGNVEDMSRMFWSADRFNQDIGGWNTGNVEDMSSMFSRAHEFDQDLDDWDVSAVEDMNTMFLMASSFDGDLSGWDTGSLDSLLRVFDQAESFNGDVSGWDTSSVTLMSGTFRDAESFNNDSVSDWDTSNATNMSSMFEGAETFDQSLRQAWDVDAVQNCSDFAEGADAWSSVRQPEFPNCDDWP